MCLSKLVCIHRCEVADNTVLFRFFPDSLDGLELNAGSSVQISFSDKADTRYYTIVTIHPDQSFDIIVRDSLRNEFSSRLVSQVKTGDVLTLNSYSDGNNLRRIIDSSNVTIVTGGIGITLALSIVSLVMTKRPNELQTIVDIMICERRRTLIPMQEYLIALTQKYPWFNVHFFISGEHEKDNDFFSFRRLVHTDLQKEKCSDTFVLCGSPSFVNDVRDMMSSLPNNIQVHAEAFSSARDRIANGDVDTENSGIFKLIELTSARSLEGTKSRTILENLISNKIDINSKCHMGVCGSCISKLVDGSVSSEDDFCLTSEQKKNGFFLPCISHACSEKISIEIL
ncbi:flavin reductase family protein [Aeromonas veronii]